MYGGPFTQEAPNEIDFPEHQNLYVMQETANFPLRVVQFLCYNLESNSTEITFNNPSTSKREASSGFVEMTFRQFPPSFNGNVTCRSKTNGKESTVFVASE